MQRISIGNHALNGILSGGIVEQSNTILIGDIQSGPLSLVQAYISCHTNPNDLTAYICIAKSPKPIMTTFKKTSDQISHLIKTDHLKFLDISWDMTGSSLDVNDYLAHIQSQMDALFRHFSVNHLVIDSLLPSLIIHLPDYEKGQFVSKLLLMLSHFTATVISFLPTNQANYLYPIFDDYAYDQIMFYHASKLNYTSYYLTTPHAPVNHYRFLNHRTAIEILSLA